MQIFANGQQRFFIFIFSWTSMWYAWKKIRLKKSRSTHQYSTMFFQLLCITLYTGYLDLLQYDLFLKCQLFHWTTLQVSFSRVLWKLKFLLSPSRSFQRKSYNCNTLLRKRDWITTKQNSLSHLFKPYQTWMKSHTSTHCGPIFHIIHPQKQKRILQGA